MLAHNPFVRYGQWLLVVYGFFFSFAHPQNLSNVSYNYCINGDPLTLNKCLEAVKTSIASNQRTSPNESPIYKVAMFAAGILSFESWCGGK